MHATIDDVMDGVGLPLLGIVPEDSSVTLAAAAGTALALYTGKGAARACLNIVAPSLRPENAASEILNLTVLQFSEN